jgi:hypothetical protein
MFLPQCCHLIVANWCPTVAYHQFLPTTQGNIQQKSIEENALNEKTRNALTDAFHYMNFLVSKIERTHKAALEDFQSFEALVSKSHSESAMKMGRTIVQGMCEGMEISGKSVREPRPQHHPHVPRRLSRGKRRKRQLEPAHSAAQYPAWV